MKKDKNSPLSRPRQMDILETDSPEVAEFKRRWAKATSEKETSNSDGGSFREYLCYEWEGVIDKPFRKPRKEGHLGLCVPGVGKDAARKKRKKGCRLASTAELTRAAALPAFEVRFCRNGVVVESHVLRRSEIREARQWASRMAKGRTFSVRQVVVG